MNGVTAGREDAGRLAGAVVLAALVWSAGSAAAQNSETGGANILPAVAVTGLPDAPSTVRTRLAVTADGAATLPLPQAPGNRTKLPPCHQNPDASHNGVHVQQDAQGKPEETPQHEPKSCQDEDPVQSIVTQRNVKPLSPRDKATLAARDVIDPFNLVTVVGYSAIEIAANSHSAYGPGFAGWGRLTGYTFAEDIQGEFFGTFLIPSLVHEDPRYHRMPDAPFKKRLWHAITHTEVSRRDDGRPMPNYATLGTYPISALLSNAYVPGIASSPTQTIQRIGLGLATDPAGAIVAEFLPDVAKRIHVRVVFVQEIVNQIATQSTGPSIQ